MTRRATLVRIAPIQVAAARPDGPLYRDLAAWVRVPTLAGDDVLGPYPLHVANGFLLFGQGFQVLDQVLDADTLAALAAYSAGLPAYVDEIDGNDLDLIVRVDLVVPTAIVAPGGPGTDPIAFRAAGIAHAGDTIAVEAGEAMLVAHVALDPSAIAASITAPGVTVAFAGDHLLNVTNAGPGTVDVTLAARDDADPGDLATWCRVTTQPGGQLVPVLETHGWVIASTDGEALNLGPLTGHAGAIDLILWFGPAGAEVHIAPVDDGGPAWYHVVPDEAVAAFYRVTPTGDGLVAAVIGESESLVAGFGAIRFSLGW